MGKLALAARKGRRLAVEQLFQAKRGGNAATRSSRSLRCTPETLRA